MQNKKFVAPNSDDKGYSVIAKQGGKLQAQQINFLKQKETNSSEEMQHSPNQSLTYTNTNKTPTLKSNKITEKEITNQSNNTHPQKIATLKSFFIKRRPQTE